MDQELDNKIDKETCQPTQCEHIGKIVVVDISLESFFTIVVYTEELKYSAFLAGNILRKEIMEYFVKGQIVKLTSQNVDFSVSYNEHGDLAEDEIIEIAPLE